MIVNQSKLLRNHGIYGKGPMTITHEAFPECITVNFGGTPYNVDAASYAIGWREPRFPMPAIVDTPTVVFRDWFKWSIVSKYCANWYQY